MSRLALTRLVVAGNRSSRWRLAGIAAGVMVGIALFLLLFAASQAFADRSLRSTWIDVAWQNQTRGLDTAIRLAPDEAAVAATAEHYRDDVIRALAIAVPNGATIRIPGVERAPMPGEYVASPALAALIDDVPAEELGDRFGAAIGTISADALEGPDSLVVIIGAPLDAIVASGWGQIVTEFIGYDFSSQNYRMVALIGAIAVLIPVLLLISIVTDLGAVQRAERFATLRLIGATPGQVARVAATETAATTVVGTLLGVGLYLATIPLAARLTIGTSTFYPSDLLTSAEVMAAAVILTVLGATAVAWWRTSRALIGPLGATRERHEREPRRIALVPLVLGVALLGTGVWLHELSPLSRPAGFVLLAGFLLTTAGLLVAGPVVTAWAARAGQARAGTAAQVIGFNRIVRHPRAAFRAVAGLVVALYTVTVFAVGITAATGVDTPTEGEGRLPLTTLYAVVTDDQPAVASLEARLGDLPGVTAVVTGTYTYDGDIILSGEGATSLGAPADAGQVAIGSGWLHDSPARIGPATDAPGDPILFAATDGSSAAIERARTAIITSDLTLRFGPSTRADHATDETLTMANQFAALAYLGILVAATISTISLAVSTLSATIGRRRLLAMLRLTGMPHITVRSIITYETVLPVATVLLTSIGLGAYTAWAIVTGLSTHRTVSWPIPGYYVVLAACLALAGLAIAATAHSARRLVSGTTIRFE